jgi:hypothetical protein
VPRHVFNCATTYQPLDNRTAPVRNPRPRATAIIRFDSIEFNEICDVRWRMEVRTRSLIVVVEGVPSVSRAVQ